jgi:hypothetical protein
MAAATDEDNDVAGVNRAVRAHRWYVSAWSGARSIKSLTWAP